MPSIYNVKVLNHNRYANPYLFYIHHIHVETTCEYCYDRDLDLFLTFTNLLAANAKDIDTGDKFGRTPLMFCVLGDRMECAELLIKAGTDVNRKDIGGRTSMHWAAHKVRGIRREVEEEDALACTGLLIWSRGEGRGWRVEERGGEERGGRERNLWIH